MQSNALKVNNYASLQNIGVITYAIEKVMNRAGLSSGFNSGSRPVRLWKDFRRELCCD